MGGTILILGRTVEPVRYPLLRMLHRLVLVALLPLLLAVGCEDESSSDPRSVPGLAVSTSPSGVDATMSQIVAALEANEAVSIVARIDHAANARQDGMTLPPSQVVVFGNPALGTPVMQTERRAGLDLPQKMLVYQDPDGVTQVVYNSGAYLAARYGLGDLPQLERMDTALRGLAENATGDSVTVNGVGGVAGYRSVVVVESDADVETTYGRLLDAIRGRGDLTVIAELDHAANAAAVGLDLPPTRLVAFGSPDLGSILMQYAPTIAIDLPQTMLVWEAGGEVLVGYEDPLFLTWRHGINDAERMREDPLYRMLPVTIRDLLAELAASAAGA